MTKPSHTVQVRGDSASRDAVASENSVAKEEKSERVRDVSQRKVRISLFLPRRDDFSFTMDNINEFIAS